MLLLPHMSDRLVGMDLPSAPPQILRRRRSARTHARRATTIATLLIIFLDEFAFCRMRLLLCTRAGARLRVHPIDRIGGGLPEPATPIVGKFVRPRELAHLVLLV